ncbi:MAG: insulinase family protein [Massilibacteroides sp.]|nr:insulinase family protein [Massilibacteroides sp.]
MNLFFPYEKLADSLYASVEGIRTDYLQTVVSSLLNERLDEKLYVSNPPFVFAQSSIGNYMGTQTKSAWSIAAIAEEGRVDSTLLVLAQETERVNRFGFTFSECERMKVNVLKYYESLYLERDNEENATYAESYVAHFTNGGYLPSIETEYDLVSRIAEETTVEDINIFARAILSRRNQAIISLTGPDKNDLDIYPEKSALLDIFESVADRKLLPYQENDSLPPLLAAIPVPGEIVKEDVDTLFHALHLTLGNGVQVVAKQTSFKEDEIVVSGTSPGGSTLFDKKDSHNLKVLTDVVSLGGLGEHSATDIGRILAGKNVSCSISLDENSESVGGYASVSDLRTLFELIHLHFVRSREDDEAFSSYCTRLSAQLKNLDLNPMVAFGDSLTVALYGNNPLVMRITEEEIKRLDYKRILAMYEERFADASDFVFTIVGSFQLDTVRALAKEYLATLPVLPRIEQGNEKALVPYRKGVFRNVFRKKMETPKASIVHYYHGNTEYNLKNILSANILTQLLDLVYMEKVRKDEGGSYGVSSLARLFAFPKGRITLQIFYDTDPSKWQQIDSIVQSELHQLIVQVPRNEDIAKIKKNLIKTYEENRTNNIYWLSVIDNYYFSSFDSHSNYLQTLERITAKDISDLVRKIQSQNNDIEIVLLPEESVNK